MKKLLYFITLITLCYACGSSKSVQQPKKTKKTNPVTSPSLADKIIWTAVSYKGTPYKFGGTSKKGMDCSGLVFISFKKRNITLPRTSKSMYSVGRKIPLSSVKRGDLLFFKTSKKRGNVNHVGLVTSIKNGTVYFIHATSSRGVLVSSLRQKYWKRAFIRAKRILN